MLEAELQPKLKNPRVMGIHRMKEGVAGQTVDATASRCGIVGTGGTVATNDVVTGVAGMRGVINSELRVVEDIECLGSELQISLLAEDFEMFQQREIEIYAAGIVERIATAISERQSARSEVGCWVVKERPESLCYESSFVGKLTARIANTIGVRTGSKVVGHPTIVRDPNSARASSIDYAKWCAGLKNSDSGKLPSAQ